MSDVDFRALGPDDEEELAAMFVRNAVPEVTRHFHPFDLDRDTARRLVAHDGRDRYYVADKGGAIVGISMLRGWDEGYSVPSLGILVDRDFHGQGIGRQFTDFVVHEARRLGSTEIRLSVYATNTVAYRLYRERDFVEESRTQVETAYGEDIRIVMTKHLTP